MATRPDITPRTMLRVGPQLRRAIGLLGMRNAEIGEEVARTTVRNSFLRIRGGGVSADAVPDHAPGLYAHVAQEILLLRLGPDERAIASSFVEALEPSGWLGTGVEHIARQSDCSVPAAEVVLAQLQEISPPGMFARSLSECLRLQLLDQGNLTETMLQVLDALPAMAKGGATALAQSAGLSKAETENALRLIRGLDPKPGAQFIAHDPALLRAPDILAELTASGWNVALNPDTQPNIEVLAMPKTDDPRLRREAKEAMAFAAMIAQRNQTVLGVATTLAARQSAFLLGNAKAPVALRRRDVAAMISVHESTVSRICSAMTIEGPRGVLALADLFSRRAPNCTASLADVQMRIRQIVEDEHALHPLSDTAITRQLAQDGIPLARRSVARYRNILGIPARHERRHNP